MKDIMKFVAEILEMLIKYGMLTSLALCIWILFKGLTMTRCEDTKECFSEHAFSKNKENELECRKNDLENLKKEKEINIKIRKYMTYFWVMCIVLYQLLYMTVIIKMLLVVAIIIISFELWDCFINSDNTVAIRIAEISGKRSIAIEIKKCRRDIKELEELIEIQNKKECENKTVIT